MTSIGFQAFSYCTSLTSVTIPDSITSIGSMAFSDTPWLEEKQKENPLVIVNNILIHGRNCSGDVVIPDGVTSISGYAFFGCSNITSVIIPDSVTSIGGYAFHGCRHLTEITIPYGVTELEISIFSDCENLTSVTIPDSVTSIGFYVFDDCSNLTSITIPDSVTSIGFSAFSGCKKLTSITIPDSVTTIDFCAFEYCTGLTEITIPDSITSIGRKVFYNCSNITSVIIPDSVTSIGDEAFRYCSKLTSVTIPDSVTSIDGDAFYDTPWLEEKQKENPLVVVNNILIDGSTCSGDVVIPDSVTSIADLAFYYKSNYTSSSIAGKNLTSVTIPDSVTSIGCLAFDKCENLTEITILNPDCEIYDSGSTFSNGDKRNDLTGTWDDYFNGTIYGYENSTAQEYAEKYGYKFVSLGTAPEKNAPTGDMNGDGDFNVSDIVTFQKYILGASDTEISDWKQADLNSDGLLDSFDLCLMKKKLIGK